MANISIISIINFFSLEYLNFYLYVIIIMNENMNNLIGGREESYDIRNYENGISRKKVNNEFVYFYIKTKNEIPKHELDRIYKLKIPPAWTDLWISIDHKSNIQAIGTDTKGRKQYIYHHKHIVEAEKKKFSRLFNFIRAIPNLEKIIKNHNKLPAYHKYKVIATMLLIVKELHLRVGKEQYARENKSYGVSSLKKSHLKFEGDTIKLKFKGKSKKILSYSLKDSNIKEHLQFLLKLEGDKLFQYLDENDKVRKITDSDLNHYIQDHMGSEFTIKDFRTYAANFHFIRAILDETKKRTPKNEKVIKKNILNALKTTAHYLRHTKAISKKSYVMNFVTDLYQSQSDYFVKRKYDDPNEVLIDLLKLYKKNILHRSF